LLLKSRTMKTLFRSCLVLLFFCAVAVSEAAVMPTNTINAVLGDVSFVKKFGTAPTPASGEALRIRTHLEYVETLLRAEDISHLSPTLRERRAALLDKLHEYRLTSAFPTNLDFPQERRPCFIDAAGNICAVGFLIEQTAGRALAERINAAHRYDFLADIHVPELTAWVEASGLTARECAMIQPGYSFFPTLIRDTDCKASIIFPLTTTANSSAYRMEVRLQGIAEYVNVTASNLLVTLNGLNLSHESITLTTREGRKNCIVSLIIPPMPSTTSGVQILNFYFFVPNTDPNSSGIPDRYFVSTIFTVSPATTVRDLTLPSTIPISPNPVTNALTLALPENELHNVRLTNTLGCAVWTLSEASGTTTLDVGGLSAGVYFVEVQSARRRSVQKVVKY
jgi:hypothetical protein